MKKLITIVFLFCSFIAKAQDSAPPSPTIISPAQIFYQQIVGGDTAIYGKSGVVWRNFARQYWVNKYFFKKSDAADDTTAVKALFVICYGDSFFNKYEVNSALAYLGKLSGWSISNQGIPGQTCTQIANRFFANKWSWKYPLLFDFGRNSLSHPDSVRLITKRIVDTLTKYNNKRWVFLSIFNQDIPTEWAGTAIHDTIVALNSNMLARAGSSHYLDWWTYAKSLRRSPATHQDTIDINHDVVIKPYRYDNLHLQNDGNSYMGGFLYTNRGLLLNDTPRLITTENFSYLIKNGIPFMPRTAIPVGGNNGGLAPDLEHFSYDPNTNILSLTQETLTNNGISPIFNLTTSIKTGMPADGFGLNIASYIKGSDGIPHLMGWSGFARNGNDSSSVWVLKVRNNGVVVNPLKAWSDGSVLASASQIATPSTYNFATRRTTKQFAIEYNTTKAANFDLDVNADLTISGYRKVGFGGAPTAFFDLIKPGTGSVPAFKLPRGVRLNTLPVSGYDYDGVMEIDTADGPNFSLYMIQAGKRRLMPFVSGVRVDGDLLIYNSAQNAYASTALGVDNGVTYTPAVGGARLGLDAISPISVSIRGVHGAGYVDLLAQDIDPATPPSGHNYFYADASGRVTFLGPNGYKATLTKTLLSASRVFSFPDATTTLDGIDNAASISNKTFDASNLYETTTGIGSLQSKLNAYALITRVDALSSNSGTYSVNTDNYDYIQVTGQTAAITNFTVTGTPATGRLLRVSITGTASVGITLDPAKFENSGSITLPTTTNGTSRLDFGFAWNSETSKWRIFYVF